MEPMDRNVVRMAVDLEHTSTRSPVIRDQPDVTCPSDLPDSDKRKEVVHHEQIPGHDVANSKKKSSDKKSNLFDSNVVIKAKSIPVTPKSVASSQGALRERWLISIYRKLRTSCRTWQSKMLTHHLLSNGRVWANGHFRAK